MEQNCFYFCVWWDFLFERGSKNKFVGKRMVCKGINCANGQPQSVLETVTSNTVSDNHSILLP